MKIYFDCEDIETKLFERIFEIVKGEGGIPVILCLGADRVICDSLGPLVGTLLKNKYNALAYIYGTLDKPINAKNAEQTYNFIRNTHTGSQIIVVDAAIGKSEDIGFIKIAEPQKMSFFNGTIPPLNHYSVTAVTGSDILEFTLLKTKLDEIGKMADVIAQGLSSALFISSLNKTI